MYLRNILRIRWQLSKMLKCFVQICWLGVMESKFLLRPVKKLFFVTCHQIVENLPISMFKPTLHSHLFYIFCKTCNPDVIKAWIFNETSTFWNDVLCNHQWSSIFSSKSSMLHRCFFKKISANHQWNFNGTSLFQKLAHYKHYWSILFRLNLSIFHQFCIDVASLSF